MPPLKIISFELWFHYEIRPPAGELTIDYTPIAGDDAGQKHRLTDHSTQFRLSTDNLPENLSKKLVRLTEYAESQLTLTVPEIEVQGVPLRSAPRLNYIQGHQGRPDIHVTYYVTASDRNSAVRDLELSEATRRLVDNIYPMCEQQAWSHLRERFGHPAQPTRNAKRKVFLSYRFGNDERSRFVEAIANRLGREGFLPWFDKWEIKAGDSIARELASGFQDVYGIVIILSADYPAGAWAREEMETAITKRIEEDIKIIPVLYETCERPQLLRPLRYLDCREHSEANFERQFSDVIDALNEIELNPYR